MSYPKIINKINWSKNIVLQKWKLAELCFYATSNCRPIDLTDYEVEFKIYQSWSVTIGIPQKITTVIEPAKWKACFVMTTNDNVDNYCGLSEWACYKYEVVASKKTAPYWDCINMWCWTICIEKCNLSK